jgi:2'-5' RNA ligase
MRLFIAIDLDDAVRTRIARFVDEVEALAPDARWMKPESLHVTLKFIGEQPDPAIEGIEAALRMISAPPVVVEFRGCGFFPTATAARVFWIGVDGGAELARLAAIVDEKTATLGIAKEDRPYTPHLTLARGSAGRGSGSSGSPRTQRIDRPNRAFQRLQEKLSVLPTHEFGTMTAREFFSYRSELSPKGSKYTKLAEFKLSAV